MEHDKKDDENIATNFVLTNEFKKRFLMKKLALG